MNPRPIAVAGSILLAITAFYLFVPAIPQDTAYHGFADGRTVLGITNFWNVVSNLPFVVIGAWGTLFVFRHGRSACVAGLELAYVVFFAGIFLTALGSGYYHLAPANEPLVWDRLPMTIALSGLFALLVGEFVSPSLGRSILIPLLVLGAFSVEYWAFTESRGAGDLRAYVVFQFLPILLIPIILLSQEPVTGTVRYYWIMLAFYIASKTAEFLDGEILAIGGWISGHTLKHLLASLVPATLLYALALRRQTDAAANDD